MTLLRRFLELGALAPNPRDLSLFSARMDLSCFHPGDRLSPSPAFPAAEPVARVASQHCPIPSGSGRISINHAVRSFNEKASNGDDPLNFVSHLRGSLHWAVSCPPTLPTGPLQFLKQQQLCSHGLYGRNQQSRRPVR
jgi:hypothetical protein